MKKNKVKGFTLIELLAVIVILAIIALIATPIILGIVEETSLQILDIKNITKINSISELEIKLMESNKGYIGNTEIQPKRSNSFAFQKEKEETR